jgi:hypothetical protein
MDSLRVLNPKNEIVWRVLKGSPEIRSLANASKRRPHVARCPGYARDDVAGGAAIMDHEVRSVGSNRLI